MQISSYKFFNQNRSRKVCNPDDPADQSMRRSVLPRTGSFWSLVGTGLPNPPESSRISLLNVDAISVLQSPECLLELGGFRGFAWQHCLCRRVKTDCGTFDECHFVGYQGYIYYQQQPFRLSVACSYTSLQPIFCPFAFQWLELNQARKIILIFKKQPLHFLI